VTIDPLFGASGFYRQVLESNALLHREASAVIIARAASLLRGARAPVRVLDLACGGAPVTVAGIMQAFPATAFSYLGVDIHPDQVNAARSQFRFPANATRVELCVGDAWAPDAGAGPFDLVFMGMNLHHGTPAQVGGLARCLAGLLAPGGMFVNHDWFRPDADAYAAPGSGDAAPWRLAFRDGLRARLLAAGAGADGAREVAEHVTLNDFPVSRREFAAAFDAAGLNTDILELQADLPLSEFIAVACATRP